MRFQYSPYALPLFLAAAMELVLAIYALRRRNRPEALVFGLLSVSLFWWSLCYGLNVTGSNLETQYLFNRLKYIGALAVPPLWVILGLQYAQRQQALDRRTVLLIFLPAIILLPVVLTDHWSHLWWTRVWATEFDGQQAFGRDHSILYYAYVVISYGYYAWGLLLYIQFYRRAQPLYRAQAALMITAVAIPLIASILTQFGFSPMPWGMDTFFFSVSSLLLAVAIFRYGFLDIIPAARQAVVDQIPEGVIVIDVAGRVVDINPVAREMIDLQEVPPLGKPLAEVVGIPEVREILLECTRTGDSRGLERDVQLNGRVISVHVSTLTHNTAGRVGQIVLLRDISERVAAQTELESLYRQAEVERERLALTIQTASDAIALLDADGRTLSSNPAARQILKGVGSHQLPADVQEVLKQAQEGATSARGKASIDGRVFEVAAAPIPGTGLVVTMHDVTHFEQLARLKDEFVSTVSHDLRSPLTSILGFTQLGLMPNASEQQRIEALKRVEIATKRMSTLVTDLLDLAMLEAGMEYETTPVPLDLLARHMIEELEGAALAKGVTIVPELTPSLMVMADPRLVTQVWRNLIGNAIKYTQRGTITIRARALDNQVLAQVADTGVGIASADLPFVFDKFFRAKDPYRRGAEGTGLGLALVKSIVEKHHGRTWVESEPGVGSTFSFILPLHLTRR